MPQSQQQNSYLQTNGDELPPEEEEFFTRYLEEQLNAGKPVDPQKQTAMRAFLREKLPLSKASMSWSSQKVSSTTANGMSMRQSAQNAPSTRFQPYSPARPHAGPPGLSAGLSPNLPPGPPSGIRRPSPGLSQGLSPVVSPVLPQRMPSGQTSIQILGQTRVATASYVMENPVDGQLYTIPMVAMLPQQNENHQIPNNVPTPARLQNPGEAAEAALKSGLNAQSQAPLQQQATPQPNVSALPSSVNLPPQIPPRNTISSQQSVQTSRPASTLPRSNGPPTALHATLEIRAIVHKILSTIRQNPLSPTEKLVIDNIVSRNRTAVDLATGLLDAKIIDHSQVPQFYGLYNAFNNANGSKRPPTFPAVPTTSVPVPEPPSASNPSPLPTEQPPAATLPAEAVPSSMPLNGTFYQPGNTTTRHRTSRKILIEQPIGRSLPYNNPNVDLKAIAASLSVDDIARSVLVAAGREVPGKTGESRLNREFEILPSSFKKAELSTLNWDVLDPPQMSVADSVAKKLKMFDPPKDIPGKGPGRPRKSLTETSNATEPIVIEDDSEPMEVDHAPGSAAHMQTASSNSARTQPPGLTDLPFATVPSAGDSQSRLGKSMFRRQASPTSTSSSTAPKALTPPPVTRPTAFTPVNSSTSTTKPIMPNPRPGNAKMTLYGAPPRPMPSAPPPTAPTKPIATEPTTKLIHRVEIPILTPPKRQTTPPAAIIDEQADQKARIRYSSSTPSNDKRITPYANRTGVAASSPASSLLSPLKSSAVPLNATDSSDDESEGEQTNGVGKKTDKSEQSYHIYKCKWIGCTAELHSFENLEHHVLKVHGKADRNSKVFYVSVRLTNYSFTNVVGTIAITPESRNLRIARNGNPML